MGNMSGSYGSHYSLWLSITQNFPQDIVNNTTNVTVKMYLSFDGSSYYAYTNNQTSGSMAIEGITYNFSVSSINFASGQAKDILLAEWTGDIKHDDTTGEKSMSVYGSWDTGTTRIGSGTCSVSQKLNTIPRTSTIFASTANIQEKAVITIDSANSDFRHDVWVIWGSLNTTIFSKIAGGSYEWLIPEEFYSMIPNDTVGLGTIFCNTYSADGTYIGQSTASFVATTSEDECSPIVTATVVDINPTTVELTGDANKIIKHKSTAQIDAITTAKHYASISKTTVNGTAIENNQIVYNDVSKSMFEIVVTDSRGYTTTCEVNPEIIEYIPLTLNATFKRPASTTGEVELTYSGNYFDGSFGAYSNELLIEWEYKEKASTEWISGGILTPNIKENKIEEISISLGTQFDYQKNYEFRIIAQDKLTTYTKTSIVYAGKPVFNWGKDFFNINGNILQNNENIEQKLVSTTTLEPSEFENVDVGESLQRTSLTTIKNDYNWYYLINLRHRNGETDGTKYGLQIRKNFDFNGEMTIRSQREGTWSTWDNLLVAKVLHSSSSGETGDITLTDDISNFKRIDICFKDYDNQISTKTIYDANNTTACLSSTVDVASIDSNSVGIYLKINVIKLSSTKISRIFSSEIRLDQGGTYNQNTEYTAFKILKVIGYK